MNKKITLSLSLSLLAVLLCGTLIYTVYTHGDTSSQSPVHVSDTQNGAVPEWAEKVFAQSEWGASDPEDSRAFLNKQKKGSLRTLSYQKKDILLAYSYTLNRTDTYTKDGSKVSPADMADSYGFYDVYVDEQKTEYDFIYNTDILCGISMFLSESDESKDHIDQDRAVEIAKEYLLTVFPKDAVNAYKLEACVEVDWTSAYELTFYRFLGGYKTDDRLYLCMHTDGRMSTLIAWNLSRYDRFQDIADKIDGEKNRAAFAAAFAAEYPSGHYRIAEDAYITLTDKGELAFVYGVVYDTWANQHLQPIELD